MATILNIHPHVQSLAIINKLCGWTSVIMAALYIGCATHGLNTITYERRPIGGLALKHVHGLYSKKNLKIYIYISHHVF